MANHGANNSAVRRQWQSWRRMRQKELAVAVGNWVPRVTCHAHLERPAEFACVWPLPGFDGNDTETGEAAAKTRWRNTKLLGTDAQIT